ncbi:MAG: hypothetical protein ACI4S9_04115, partial [Christensenellales bacterium]
ASMPFVMSQLAPFNTGLVNDTNAIGFTVFNEIYTENANSRSESRAVVSIYDVPLDYARNDKAPIHPKKKTLIGERMGMALCCLNGYVDNNYLAPQVEKLETDGNRIILTFSNAGGGLRSLYGLPLRGFTVAGADNKYYEAYAEVTGVNRVTLYSPSVSAPINATYAFSDLCMKSNLCNELGIAAVPYRSTKENFTAYYAQHDYTSCDFLQVFRYFSVYEAGYVDMYNGKSSSIALNENGKTGNCLEITPEKTDFGFEIILSYAYDVAQFNQYETFSIYLKKSGNEDVAVSDIRIYADRIYYILEPEFQDAVLKDDFVKYTFRLDSTSYRGEEFKHNTLPITGLTKISINFTSEKSDVVVYADNIYFG